MDLFSSSSSSSSQEHLDSDGTTTPPSFLGGWEAMSLLNSLKTGNAVVDMALAMCLPVLLRVLVSLWGRAERCLDWQKIYLWFFPIPAPDFIHHRYITYRGKQSMYGGSTQNSDPDSQNTVLLKAIQLYIHSQVQPFLQSAHLHLTTTQDQSSDLTSSSSRSSYYDYYHYDHGRNNNDEDEEDQNPKTVVGILSKYKIVKNPPSQEWHQLGEYGQPPAAVDFCIEEQAPRSGEGEEQQGGQTSDNKNETVKTFHFTSKSGSAIDEFIDKAYAWYLQELRKTEDRTCRYYYDLLAPPLSLDEQPSNTYGRYKLSNEKTFDSLFFRQKESLMQLVDNFQRKSGKYAIAGYPHKLGILLHGPPGTGKTSLIKSLAHYTQRSIVNVPLSRISTNTDLAAIFFDRRYQVQGEYAAVRLNFKDVIFVMEDVDAASGVVKRRDGKKVADFDQADRPQVVPLTNWWKLMLQSREQDCRDLVQMLSEKSERLKEEAHKPEIMTAIAQRLMNLPGFGLMSAEPHMNDPVMRQLKEEALSSAGRIMDDRAAMDRFLADQASTLKMLLEAGVSIDKDFEDAMLGIPPQGDLPNSLIRAALSPTGVDSTGQPDNSDEASLGDWMGPAMPGFGAGNTAIGGNAKDSKPAKKGASNWFSKFDVDRLNLTGLLNVLDGVVDTPGRILIMTTNHPEHLDPALIRPGRIDKKIKLGYMAAPDVVSMLEHYYCSSLSPSQRVRIGQLLASEANGPYRVPMNLTPAQVEQMTSEYDDVEDMIRSLETKSGVTKMCFGPEPDTEDMLDEAAAMDHVVPEVLSSSNENDSQAGSEATSQEGLESHGSNAATSDDTDSAMPSSPSGADAEGATVVPAIPGMAKLQKPAKLSDVVHFLIRRRRSPG